MEAATLKVGSALPASCILVSVCLCVSVCALQLHVMTLLPAVVCLCPLSLNRKVNLSDSVKGVNAFLVGLPVFKKTS